MRKKNPVTIENDYEGQECLNEDSCWDNICELYSKHRYLDLETVRYMLIPFKDWLKNNRNYRLIGFSDIIIL